MEAFGGWTGEAEVEVEVVVGKEGSGPKVASTSARRAFQTSG